MPQAQSRSPGPPPKPDRDQPEAVGKYRIIRRLGEGGMGSVFLAQDTVLRREVALKLPLSGTENDPEVRERFLREARSAATLDHPYICRVHDAGEVDGRLYLAMAYVEGQSLADLVRAEGMPPRQVVALVGKLAIALQEAHVHGVVHRDLKPRNVMIRAVGSKREPVIVDFGLARLEGPEDVRMTQTGQVMGTPAYMAPEQLLGKPDEIGPPCDIYALGVILYELLTGRLPFVGPYPVLVAQILTQPPLPPSTHRPGLDASLDAICLKAMAKDVSERYASMIELATALTGYLRDARPNSTSDSPASPIRRPVESDSIPTGADTLVKRLLGRDDNEARTPSHREPGETGPSPRALPARRPPRAVLMVSLSLGLFLVAGIIIVFTNAGGDRSSIDGTPIVTGSGGDRPGLGVIPIVTGNGGDRTKIDVTPTVTNNGGDRTKTGDSPRTITNSIGMKLNLIQDGEFLMGASDGEPEAEDGEKPRHRMRITRPFYLGMYEVTQGEYQAVMGNNPSHFSAGGAGKDQIAGMATARFPVEQVSWFDAVAFCNKLSEREGLRRCYGDDGKSIAAGTGYRLPTEAEWEYACRAGTTTVFAFGDRLSPTEANLNGDFSYNGSDKGPSLNRTASVGTYRPNLFGLFDMHGNVLEWCSDWYDPNLYKLPQVDDAQGPQQSRFHVFRGGCWNFGPLFARSARRYGFMPGYRVNFMGFRVVRVR